MYRLRILGVEERALLLELGRLLPDGEEPVHDVLVASLALYHYVREVLRLEKPLRMRKRSIRRNQTRCEPLLAKSLLNHLFLLLELHEDLDLGVEGEEHDA